MKARERERELKRQEVRERVCVSESESERDLKGEVPGSTRPRTPVFAKYLQNLLQIDIHTI